MSQKLLVMERDTEDELIEAIRMDLRNGTLGGRVVSLSVYPSDKHFTAWIVIAN